MGQLTLTSHWVHYIIDMRPCQVATRDSLPSLASGSVSPQKNSDDMIRGGPVSLCRRCNMWENQLFLFLRWVILTEIVIQTHVIQVTVVLVDILVRHELQLLHAVSVAVAVEEDDIEAANDPEQG